MTTPPKGFRPEPYEYHEELNLRVESLANLGHGVARHDGWVVHVTNVIPGELVRARIFRNHKSHSEADCIEVVEASPERKNPKCSLYGTCGGCQYQHVAYETQLLWKRKQVADSLSRIGGIVHKVEPVVASPKPYGYRTKLTPHFQKGKDGKIGSIGFLRMGSRRSIVDVEQCPIATDAINAHLPDARENLRASWKGKRGGTLLLRDSQEGVTTCPRAMVSEQLDSLVFQFRASEFFQNNPFILPKFVDYVISQAKSDGLECLVDAYCGGGLFALSAARSFRSVIGVEINREGFECAKANATLNRIQNCRFFLGSASEIFADISLPGNRCSLVVDPPRKGCDETFLSQAMEFEPAVIVYVSCEPTTQARDAKIIVAGGYVIDQVQPFDLFPQTRHVENVITFRRE